MEAIGISEQEVMEYTDARCHEINITGDIPQFDDFVSKPVNPQNLNSPSFVALDAYLDSLKQHVLPE